MSKRVQAHAGTCTQRRTHAHACTKRKTNARHTNGGKATKHTHTHARTHTCLVACRRSEACGAAYSHGYFSCHCSFSRMLLTRVFSLSNSLNLTLLSISHSIFLVFCPRSLWPVAEICTSKHPLGLPVGVFRRKVGRPRHRHARPMPDGPQGRRGRRHLQTAAKPPVRKRALTAKPLAQKQ